jgi:hypothetical protein
MRSKSSRRRWPRALARPVAAIRSPRVTTINQVTGKATLPTERTSLIEEQQNDGPPECRVPHRQALRQSSGGLSVICASERTGNSWTPIRRWHRRSRVSSKAQVRNPAASGLSLSDLEAGATDSGGRRPGACYATPTRGNYRSGSLLLDGWKRACHRDVRPERCSSSRATARPTDLHALSDSNRLSAPRRRDLVRTSAAPCFMCSRFFTVRRIILCARLACPPNDLNTSEILGPSCGSTPGR